MVSVSNKESKILFDGSEVQRFDVANPKGLSRGSDISGMGSTSGSNPTSSHVVQGTTSSAGVSISDNRAADPKLGPIFLNNDKTVLYCVSRNNQITRWDLNVKEFQKQTTLPKDNPVTSKTSPQGIHGLFEFSKVPMERDSRWTVDSFVVSNETEFFLMGYQDNQLLIDIFSFELINSNPTVRKIAQYSNTRKFSRGGLVEAIGGMALLITLEHEDHTQDDNRAKISLELINSQGCQEHSMVLPPSDDKPFELDFIDIQEQAMNKTGFGNVPLTLLFLLVSNNSNSDLYSLCVAGKRVWLLGVFREIFGAKRDRTPFLHSLLLSDEGLLAISAGDRQIRKFKLNKNT